jgi:hypothetical protein
MFSKICFALVYLLLFFSKIGNLKYLEDLRKLSRDNRKNPTESEKLFWKLLNYKKKM